VWLAIALHGAGVVVDTLFHEGQARPFGLFDMLWAHALSYLGAILTVVAGRRLWRTSEPRLGCPWTAAVLAVLGVVQAIGLGVDFVSELAEMDSSRGPVIYVSSLGFTLIVAVIGTALCRRTAITR
jgi:hypothetical protein